MKNFSIKSEIVGAIRYLEINFIFFKNLIRLVCWKIGCDLEISFNIVLY